MVYLSPFAGAGWQFFNSNGVPLAGGLIYSYAAGTTTPLATYTTNLANVSNSNPIVLDSAGRLSNEIWLTANNSYKFIIQDSTAVQIGSYDNISGINDGLIEFEALLSGSTGSTLVGYNEGLSTAVTRTLQSKLQEWISVKDFGAVGNGITDDTVAIQKAINTGLPILIPAGTYIINGTLTGVTNLKLQGQGVGQTILKNTVSNHIINFYGPTTYKNINIDGITFDINGIDSGIWAEYVTNFYVTNCEFLNNQYWGISVGTQTGTSSAIINSNIVIENCIFYNSLLTYEPVLIFNSEDVTIRNCNFNNPSPANCTSIGIYQNINNILVDNCTFKNSISGIYYTISCNNIKIFNSHFDSMIDAISGASLSDNGNFGATHVYGLVIDNCIIENNTGWGAAIGATIGAVVSNTTFIKNNYHALLINQGTTIAPYYTDASNIVVNSCIFKNNIGFGINFQSLTNVNVNTIISSCMFYDDQVIPTQINPIGFGGGAHVYNNINIIGCNINAYSGGQSITIYEGSSLGNNVNLLYCLNVSNQLPINGNQLLKTRTYTVSTLNFYEPASADNIGTTGFVTDATSNTFGTTAVGGGSYGVPIYSDGVNWVIG